MIKYLVAATEAGGVADAVGRGWERIANHRYVTPERDDVRLVWRFNQMIPDPGGVTRFVRSSDFPAEPFDRFAGELGDFRWPEAMQFASFVDQGHAAWEE